MSASARRRPMRRPTLRQCFRAAQHAMTIAGALFIIYHVGFDVSVMVSNSMAPTLRGSSVHDGEWVLTERLSYRLREPRRWEVVTFRTDEGIQVMKRVVALPGETVSLAEGDVVIDGAAARRPASLEELRYYAYGDLRSRAALPCERGYFVLGDDSCDSMDSRFEGPVRRDAVIGRAWLVVWPPNRIRWVNP